MKSAIAKSRRRLAAAIALTLAAQGAYAGATITVNSNDDDAASTFCNLRNAITSAVNGASTPNCVGQVIGVYADPDTIQFDASLANATITLSQGAFLIDGVAIDLVGSGQTIDAGGLSPIFSIGNDSTFSASNLDLTGGHSASYGGGIVVGGGSHLTLTGSTVSNSSAATNGGAIYVGASGTLDLHNATVSGNSAAGSGGGIYLKSATATLTNATVSGNTATAAGGGVYATGGSLTLSASTISNNTATDRGGGVLSAHYNVLSVDHSTLSGNSGLRSGAAYLGPDSTTVITASTLSGNTAKCGTFCGGAIYAEASSLVAVDSTFSTNAAQGAASYQAGAVYLYNADGTFINTTIAGNSAHGNNYLAGALWELHSPTSTQGSLTLTNTTISTNTATSYTAAALVGGGIEVGLAGTGSDVGAATVANTIISANMPADSDIVFGAATTTWTTAYNLFGTAQNVTPFNDPASHNIFTDTPVLGPLQNNGGPTQTMAISMQVLPLSPALRAGSIALAVYSGVPLHFDQRGLNYERTFSGTIDIGAYEDQDDRIFASGIEGEP